MSYTSLIQKPYLDTTLRNQSIDVYQKGENIMPENLTSICRSKTDDTHELEQLHEIIVIHIIIRIDNQVIICLFDMKLLLLHSCRGGK